MRHEEEGIGLRWPRVWESQNGDEVGLSLVRRDWFVLHRDRLLRHKTEEDTEEACTSSALYTFVLQLSQTLPSFQIPLSSSLPCLDCPMLHLKKNQVLNNQEAGQPRTWCTSLGWGPQLLLLCPSKPSTLPIPIKHCHIHLYAH